MDTDIAVAERDDPARGMPEPGPARRLVLVPRSPGPLVPIMEGRQGEPDELDVLVDDVFGPTTDERPGRFDAALLLIGGVLLAWALLNGASPWVVVIAIGILVLGLALPARSLLRVARRTAESRRLRSAERRGYLLDITSGATAELVAAHEGLLAASELPGSAYRDRVRVAAHLALVEVASVLHGVPPEGAAQDEYVERRTRALDGLSRELRAAHDRWLAKRDSGIAAEAERRRRLVTAVTNAREELQAEDRHGALAQLEGLTMRLAAEAGDGQA